MRREYARYRTGAKCITVGGYVQVSLLKHPLFPGKIYDTEHRVVMSEHLGRRLRKGEVVHHKNHDRADNRLKNLSLKRSQSEHMKEHGGRPCAPETRKKIGDANRGRKRTREVCRRIGLANRGRKRSAEFKTKVSAGMKRYRALNPFSAETRRKLVLAAKRRVAK